MQKRLDFPDTEAGRELLRYLWDGLVLGSLQLRVAAGEDGRRNAKANTREEARLQRKVCAISHVLNGQTPPNRPEGARELNAGPQTLILEVSELERIDKLLQAVPWGGAQQMPIADLYDFLSSAPDVEKSDKRGADE